MVEREIMNYVVNCIDTHKKLKNVFLKFQDVCCNVLADGNYFNMYATKTNNCEIELVAFDTKMVAKFVLKISPENSLPIGCIVFKKPTNGDMIDFWEIYFDEKGNMFESIGQKIGEFNILKTKGFEAFCYLLLNKYINLPCFKAEETYFKNSDMT